MRGTHSSPVFRRRTRNRPPVAAAGESGSEPGQDILSPAEPSGYIIPSLSETEYVPSATSVGSLGIKMDADAVDVCEPKRQRSTLSSDDSADQPARKRRVILQVSPQPQPPRLGFSLSPLEQLGNTEEHWQRVEGGKYWAALSFAMDSFKARFMADTPFGDKRQLLGHALDALRDAFDVHTPFEFFPGMLEMIVCTANSHHDHLKHAALAFVPLMYHLDGNVSISEAARNAKLALTRGNFRFMGFWPGIKSTAPRTGFLGHPAICHVVHSISDASTTSRLWNSSHARHVLSSYNPVPLPIIAFALVLIKHVIEEYRSGFRIPSSHGLDHWKGHYQAQVDCLTKWRAKNLELWKTITTSLAEDLAQPDIAQAGDAAELYDSCVMYIGE